MPKNTAIEDRIKMLLAKAESTNSPHEAEALSEAAEKLMLKHSITDAMLAARGDGPVEEIVSRHIEFTGIYVKTFLMLANYVADSLGTTRGYQLRTIKNGEWVTVAVVVGFESDADRAVYLIRSLERQGLAAVKDFWKKHPYRGKGILTKMQEFVERREFLIGFAGGAARRIQQNQQHEVNETEGAALVLVDRGTKVEAALPEGMRTAKMRQSRGSSHANGSGWTAGNNAATGEKGIGYGQAALGR